MAPLGEVWVVAPDREQSAASHAISLAPPAAHQARCASAGSRSTARRRTARTWRSTTCMKDDQPTLMVSGINHGANLADDVTYSGTVAAAMEASLLGVPAIAFSLVSASAVRLRGTRRASPVAGARRRSRSQLPPRHAAQREHPPEVEPPGLRHHPAGQALVRRTTWWRTSIRAVGSTTGSAAPTTSTRTSPAATATPCIREKRISVTPLHLDLTDTRSMADLAGWSLEGFPRFDVDKGGD